MDPKLQTFRTRFQAVAEVEHQELQIASAALRWQQLNTVYGLVIGLGIDKPSQDKKEIYQRWAKLKK